MSIEQIDINRIQKTLLNMAKTIAAILELHNIPYMIAFGTLLGAIRHQGFIPWDDDFDFYLFDETYDEAINILRNNIPNDLFLEDSKSEPKYFHGWAHIKDKKSKVYCDLFPQDSLYTHNGISVDLYRTKKMMKSRVEEFLNMENEAYIERRKKYDLINDDEYKKRITQLNINKKNTFNVEQEEEYVYNLVPIYKCHYMKESDVFPLKKYVFSDTQFFGPASPASILTDIYGDYMQLPPYEKRRSHYSSVVFL